jgi:GNAT superfamily N-acetyltransferase
MNGEIEYEYSPPLTNAALNELWRAAWGSTQDWDFQPVLVRSLVYVAAKHDGRLVGFVNVAWDGGVHAFLLDTTTHPDWQRRGIGTALVGRAVEFCKTRGGLEWLHVDYDPHLTAFYAGCGFRPTNAGLIDLTEK